jgi:hypothetical protein
MARVVVAASSIAFHQNNATEEDTADQVCRLHATSGQLSLKGPSGAAGTVRLSGLAPPQNDTDAVSRQYFDDNRVALTKAAARVATTGALAADFDAGAGTLTASGSPAALVVDGVTLVAGDVVLVKDQTPALQNGKYRVTVPGSGVAVFVLTRTADFDSAEDVLGAVVTVFEGATHADHGFICTADSAAFVFNTSPIEFSSFALAEGGSAEGLADGAVTLPKLAPQEDGALVTFDALTGAAALVARGTYGHVLSMVADGACAFQQLDGAAIPTACIVEDMLADGAVTVAKLAPRTNSGIVGFNGETSGQPFVAECTLGTDGFPLVSMGPAFAPEFAQLQPGSLAEAAVENTNLAPQCVTRAKLGAAAVGEAELDADAVHTVHIADGQVTLPKLIGDVAGALVFDNSGAASVAAGSVVGWPLVCTGSGTYGFAALQNTALDTDCVEGVNVLAASLPLSKLASTGQEGVVVYSNAMNTYAVETSTSTGWPLVGHAASAPTFEQLTAEGIAAGAIGYEHLDSNSVDSIQLRSNSVTESALAPGSVYMAALQGGAVTAVALAPQAVTVDALADAAVTSMKLANGAVTTNALDLGCVTSDALAHSSVNTVHLNGAVVTSSNLAADSVQNGHLGDGVVDGAKVADAVLRPTMTGVGRAVDTAYVAFTDNDVSLCVGGGARVVANADGGTFTGTWSSASDTKWKALRGPVSNDPLGALDFVNGYAWTWTACGKVGAPGFGVTAQDFAKAVPAAVQYSRALDGLVVDYQAVAALSLCAAKALKAENEARVHEVADLQARLSQVEREVAALHAPPHT